MNTRILAVALVVVSFLGVRAVQAQQFDALRVVPLDGPNAGSWSGSTRTTIVIGLSNDETFTAPDCGTTQSFAWGSTEVVTLLFSASGRITLHPRTDVPAPELLPATRLSSVAGDTRQCCLDASDVRIPCGDPAAVSQVRRSTFQVIEPASAGSALFTSPVELDSDSIGVVTGQTNDDGTHTVIFKKQGSPAQQVDIATDDVLLAADVLRDLIDLGCDPDTGEHLYLADIEW